MRHVNSKDILDSMGPEKPKSSYRYSEALIEEMLSNVDIVDVLQEEYGMDLIPTGKGWFQACCPMPNHTDRSPSFGVNQESGFYSCFGCGEKGTVITFIQRVDGVSYREALVKLALLSGVDVNNQQIEMQRLVRNMDMMVKEYLGRQGASELPGGVTEVQFMLMVASRIRSHEIKCEFDEEECAWADSVYSDIDGRVAASDHKALSKVWKGLGAVIKTRFRKYNEHDDEDIPR